MEAHRVGTTAEEHKAHKGDCCGGKPKTSPPEASAKSADADGPKHDSSSGPVSNCCCGGTRRANK
jgi:hypothetical protein